MREFILKWNIFRCSEYTKKSALENKTILEKEYIVSLDLVDTGVGAGIAQSV